MVPNTDRSQVVLIDGREKDLTQICMSEVKVQMEPQLENESQVLDVVTDLVMQEYGSKPPRHRKKRGGQIEHKVNMIFDYIQKENNVSASHDLERSGGFD